jgi:hypothetical protein
MLENMLGDTTTTIDPTDGLAAGAESGVDVRECQVDSNIDLPKPPAATQVEPWPIDPIQVRAVKLMAAGCTIAYIARTLKVNERTIYRWKKHEAFRAALCELSRVSVNEMRWIARTALRNALGRLVDSMHATGTTASAEHLLRNRSLWRVAALIDDGSW